MKTKLKNTFKQIVYVVFMALLITSCEREDTEFKDSPQTETKGYSVKSVTLNEVKGNTLIKESLDIIESQFDFNKSTKTKSSKNPDNYITSALGDPIKSKDNRFTILTDDIIEIITDNFESYTFRIETPTDENSIFENFTIEKTNENQYTYYILRYTNAENSENSEFKYNISRQSVSENQINIGDFDSIFSIVDTSPVITSLYVCVETRRWESCSLGGAHGTGMGCNSGWTSTWECSWLPGHNGTGGPGSTPNNDTTGGPRGGGSSSTDNDPDSSPIYVAPILPPTRLERETDAFFENLTDAQKNCINQGFGQLKNDITAYFEKQPSDEKHRV